MVSKYDMHVRTLGKGRRMKSKSTSRYGASNSLVNARAIARINKRTGGFRGLSLKFLDLSISNTTIANNQNMTGGELDPTTQDCLNAMVEGNTPSARLGRFIEMRSIKVKGRVQFAEELAIATPPGEPVVSLFLVMDKQTNTAQMASQDLFTNKGASITLLSSLFMDMENTDRFQILDSVKIKLTVDTTQQATDVYSHSGAETLFSLSYRWKSGKRVLFTGGAGGTVSNIADNSLHVIGFVNSNDPCTVTYNSRLRFTTS